MKRKDKRKMKVKKKKRFKVRPTRDELLLKLDPKKLKWTLKRGSEEDTKMVAEAQEQYGRKWRAGFKSKKRKAYREKKDPRFEIEDLSTREKELIKMSLLAMGSVQKRYNTCGKKNCACMRYGEKHGPYYYLSLPLPAEMVKAGLPRMKHLYITYDEAVEYNKRIRDFKALQDQIWDEIWEEYMESMTAFD